VNHPDPTRRAVARRAALLSLVILLAAPAYRAEAQGYYNLDAGRPGRIEDATPTERHELEIQLLSLRFEQFAAGTRRWRTDAKVAYGVAPFTEVELRVPVVVVDPSAAGAATSVGVSGLAIGVLHALTIETGAIPALAVAGELSLPVGGLAAPVGSWSAKLLGSKSFPLARLQVNVGYGSWSVRPAPAAAPGCPASPAPGEVPPPGCGEPPPVYIPDTPCDRAPIGAMLTCAATSPRALAGAAAVAGEPATVGSRWMAAIGADHAFALSSTLVSAGVVAERFIGLYDALDWSAEVGLRRQLTPQLVADVGVTRHFFGIARSNAITVGFSYGIPLQRFRPSNGSE
jgi:hypothetical protein